MKEIKKLNELHKILLQILDYIDDICAKNNLSYYLAGGTLLGAIRHQGFIPWDDDVDISMPREDYEKLKVIVKKHNNSKYKCVYLESESYHLCFYKIVDTRTIILDNNRTEKIGVFVDVFPIDGYGNDFNNAKVKIKKMSKVSSNVVWSDIIHKNESIGKKCIRLLFRQICILFGKETLLEIIQKLYCSNFNSSKYIGSSFGLRCEREIIERECFQSYKYAPFENRSYRIPVGYDQYLRQMYGDYMKLPPKEQQVRPHSNERIFWRDAK